MSLASRKTQHFFKNLSSYKSFQKKGIFRQKAFTLIEVMAAVAIFTISSVGLYTVNQQSVLLANRLENKTLAHWVALNTFNRLDIESELPSAGVTTGKETMAGIEWQIKTDIAETPIKTVRQVTIQVSDESDQQYISIVGFVGSRKPLANDGF